MSQQRETGALKIAERTMSVFGGLVSGLPDDARLSRDDITGLVMDANVLVVTELAPKDREMRAFVKWAEEKGMPRPKGPGIAQRLGLV